MRWHFLLACFCLNWIATSAFVMGQSQARTPLLNVPEATTFPASSTLVLVPALVRDKAGELVFTLAADDFVLTDDGVAQRLTLDQDTGGEPLAMVVVVEAGAATRSAGWHPESRKATPDRFQSLPTMIEAMTGGVPHRIAVVGFDSQPRLLQDFTSDADSVASRLREFSEEDGGDQGAAILDGVGFALDLLRRQPPQYRRAILLLSETNDRGSKLSLGDALRDISDTNTAIYSVAFSTGYAEASRYGSRMLPTKRVHRPVAGQVLPVVPVSAPNTAENSLSGAFGFLTTGIFFENPDPYASSGCMGEDTSARTKAPQGKMSKVYDCLGQLAPPLALLRMAAIAATDDLHRNTPKAVARLTGGEYFTFNDSKSLERDLAAIANHLPNRYVLSFQPRSPHPGYHSLNLKLRDYKFDVTARGGYWADAGIPVDGRP